MITSDVWIVIPALNEAENLEHLVPAILEQCRSSGIDGTILVVDDGSQDATHSVLESLIAGHPTVRGLRLRRNYGKAEALHQGFELALAEGARAVVMMDADGQDDPSELPRLLSEDLDVHGVVTGARLIRHDRFVKRTTSRLYNRATGLVARAPGRDFNSGYKVLSAAAVTQVLPMLYGELHRYITVIAFWRGFPVLEVPVQHHERLHGQSKYGPARFWRGFMDLLTVRFLMSYQARPSHLFGGLGVFSCALGSVVLAYMTFLRLSGESVGGRPALLAGVLLVLVGLQLLLFGLLAELVVFSRQDRRATASPVGETLRHSASTHSP